jgi:hypothetical protein
MTYRIPKDIDIAKAIDNCLTRTPRIRSQAALYELVITELMCVDESYRVSNERIRRVGIRKKLFNLEIRYAHTNGASPYKKCPVCRGELESIRNMTLDGKTVELSRNCRTCGYSAKSDACRPARYIITRRDR